MVFVALCLRVIVAITNYERGHNPRRTKLKAVWFILWHALMLINAWWRHSN